MKSIAILCLAACAALLMDGRTSMAQDNGEWVAMPSPAGDARWTVKADGVILSRSKAMAATLVEDGTTDAELINVSDFDLGWAAGPQFELTRHFESGWDVNMRYFGIDGWSSSHALSDPGNLRVPLVSSDPDDMFDAASADYRSQLYNVEVNLKHAWGERIHLLAGFRAVQLNEQIAADAYSPDLEGDFAFDTANNLYGFQVGAESALWNVGPVQLDGFIKAGAFGNFIRSRMQAEGTYLDPTDVRATSSRASFLGELGLTATYHIGEHWSVHGGYELMWLEGVALAGNSVAALQQYSDNMLYNGSAFYHGAVAGMEFRW